LFVSFFLLSCIFCLFILLLWIFYFYFYPYYLFFFLYNYLYHHHLLIPTVTPFNLPPSPVLKSIALLHNNSFCPFSPTLSFCPHLSLPFSSKLPLPPTHLSPAADQPTIPNLYKPNPLQSLTQTPYTATEIHPNIHKGHKKQQPLYHFPHSPNHFRPPLLVPTYPIAQTSIASLTNINIPNSHCL
jgi:hypothetical protein